jgi:hypothetical protein
MQSESLVFFCFNNYYISNFHKNKNNNRYVDIYIYMYIWIAARLFNNHLERNRGEINKW